MIQEMQPLFTTIIAESPLFVTRQLNKISQNLRGKDVVLFSISVPPSAPEILQNLVGQLSTFGAHRNTRRIGCISSFVAGTTLGVPARKFSCSIGIFPHDLAIPFHSTIPGHQPVQVGRWHSFKSTSDYEKEFSSSNYGIDVLRNDAELPPELSTLADPESIGSFIYLSDSAPHGLATTLQYKFPNASQLGLLGSSTPFITGRPVTLFDNDKIYPSGAVGIALSTSPSRSSVISNDTNNLRPLLPHSSPPMTITKSEGNMIIELDFKNPTSTLLDALKNVGVDAMNKVGEFTLDNVIFIVRTVSYPPRYFRITAGDPSRGPISLEDDTDAPPVGEQVMFFYREPPPPRIHVPNPMNPSTPERGSFTLSVLDESVMEEETDAAINERVHEGFIASSENGFMMVEPKLKPWRCSVPGLSARWEF